METVNEIQIGPNPTHGYLHISSTLPIAGYALYTVNGSLLLEATPDAISNEASIDMSGNAEESIFCAFTVPTATPLSIK